MISSNTNINGIRNNQNGLQNDLLTELADIYATPLYVYDGNKILEYFYAFQNVDPLGEFFFFQFYLFLH